MGNDLQFERAEFHQSANPVCKGCTAPLQTEYFQANGQLLCGNCAQQIRAAQAGKGSAASRWSRALLYGIGAAILGSFIYYLVSLSGSEWGLIAILVGFLVGRAVRAGSGGRGGWRYQLLAAILTYVSIVSSYLPAILHQARASAASSRIEKVEGQPVRVPISPDSPEIKSTGVAESERAASPENKPVNSLRFVFAIGIFGLIALAAPFLAGTDNIMGIIIIAIGVWEAWRVNRATVIAISGPHRMAPVTIDLPNDAVPAIAAASDGVTGV